MTKVKFNKDVIFFSWTKQEKKYTKWQTIELSELPVKNFSNYAEVVKETAEKKSDKSVKRTAEKKSDTSSVAGLIEEETK